MGSRMKDDEKFEKIVRGLAKLEHNRRCINCAALGPQYVCTNFSTFVCTICSGIHREFTHRVKSISMAKFTAAEVVALQAGGNQRAKDSYLQNWDAQKYPLPDSSYPEKLRDFIKAVYVDKRFAGDSAEQKNRLGDGGLPVSNTSRSNSNPGSCRSVTENRSEGHRLSHRQMSSGSSDGGRYEDWSFEERASPFNGKGSPGKLKAGRGRYDNNEQDEQCEVHFANKGTKNVGKFDRSQSDTSQNSYLDRQVEYQTSSSKHETQWSRERPPHHRSYGGESYSSVRELLGEDVPKLHIEDPTKLNTQAQSTGSIGLSMAAPFKEIPKQRSVSFGSSGTAVGSGAGSVIGTASLFQRANSESLIDFGTEHFPPTASVKPEFFADTTAKSGAEETSTNWASFDTLPSLAPKVETFPPSNPSIGHPILNANGFVAELHSEQLSASHNWQPAFEPLSSSYPSSAHGQDMPGELGHHWEQTQSFGLSPESRKLSGSEVQGQPSPQDMPSLRISQSGFANVGIQGELLFSLGGVQHISQGLEVGFQGYTQRPKSKNPFDLPDDSPSTSTNFPNMATLQAGLPQQLAGPFSASVMNATTHQNAHVSLYGDLPPLSYTPDALHAGGNGSIPFSFNPVLPSQQHQLMAPMLPDIAVGYQAEGSVLAQFHGFSGQSTLQNPQTPLNRTSSNPFA